MPGLYYYDHFFREFPLRPLHRITLDELWAEWDQVLTPEYRKELKGVFSLFHPPNYAEKHFQTWLQALETACLDPQLLEAYEIKESKGDLEDLWSHFHGPAKGPEENKVFEKWLRTLISIYRDQDRPMAISGGGRKTLMVEILEDKDEINEDDYETLPEYDERDSSRAAYGCIDARLVIVDESPSDKTFGDDQRPESLLSRGPHSRLPTPYLHRYQLRHPKALEYKTNTNYFGLGLWYYNAFFQDFPSRAIMANTRAEIQEEWGKVQDPKYRSELRRIFNSFHVKWSLKYDKTLVADKHLTTWLKTLEHAYTYPELLGGYNDHSVR